MSEAEFGDASEVEDDAEDFQPPASVVDGSEPGGRKSASGTSLSSTSKLRVVYDLTKACTCCLCNAKSTDESPLDGWEGTKTVCLMVAFPGRNMGNDSFQRRQWRDRARAGRAGGPRLLERFSEP